MVVDLICTFHAAQRCPDPRRRCVNSPGTLAVRRGAAPLVLQVAWEAELAFKGEGLGLLDNPKSAWSSHAKAAASGKDTRVLNLQNKERRTRDSLFSPLGHEGTYLRSIASVNARILGLWSHAICHSGLIHLSHATRWGRSVQPHRRDPTKGPNKLWKLQLIKQGEVVTLCKQRVRSEPGVVEEGAGSLSGKFKNSRENENRPLISRVVF